MKVIAGEYKGRRLAIKADGVRPTSGRVKEAVFSMVDPYIEDAVCLDLFAGSGALGIEALSRGADRAYFCDVDQDSIAALRQNLDICKIEGRRAVVLAMDWRSALVKLSEKCNLVFIDAPFDMCDYYSQILETLAGQKVLADFAAIVIEHGADAGGYLLPVGYERIREKRYGNTGIDILLYNGAE